MFEFFVFSLLFEALWLLASGGFFRYNQDGGHRGRKASVASEKIRNTRFGTNRGRLPDFFTQASRRRSLADEEDKKTIHTNTDILLEDLSEELQSEIIRGKYIENEQELYNFLESYSS